VEAVNVIKVIIVHVIIGTRMSWTHLINIILANFKKKNIVVIIWLVLSFSINPKVITLIGFHCICKQTGAYEGVLSVVMAAAA
jgi:hypothetical protein